MVSSVVHHAAEDLDWVKHDVDIKLKKKKSWPPGSPTSSFLYESPTPVCLCLVYKYAFMSTSMPLYAEAGEYRRWQQTCKNHGNQTKKHIVFKPKKTCGQF